MRTDRPVYILGYGAYIPIRRIPTSEIARIWTGDEGGPNKEKAVAHEDEDAATMAIESARRAMHMARVDEVGAVFVGTESKPYAVKPTSTIVAEALGQKYTLAADLEFACKAATEGLHIVRGLVGSGMIGSGLVVASDTAQGRPGDELEYTAASGSVAYVLGDGRTEPVANITYGTSYVTDTPDFWRRQGEPYPRHLGRFTGEPAYFHHIKSSVSRLMEETGYRPGDFRYAIFHQPNPRFPITIGLQLGFKMEQLEPGLLNDRIGNTYSASALMGLAATLDISRPGDRILLASFGSGAGSDAFVIEVMDGIVEKRDGDRSHVTVRSMVERRVEIDYAMYARYRGKVRL
ncbi:hydroxymethylglutaryl-CoA synthase [Conexivisphaera calida]|uniref:Hydroxymethylglutaryl-CoA synthase n=1 Tax=Conexivisphaera calida TaxID=1874277 RepID=A0A4V0P1I1_9ARCH|nr:hydroxymethylglutaryl-CoA synthase [Conexivisphaera calida]BBE41800.1 Hydroxymethylglutaryl-CoA synthase [Conexivisphaera calida]